MTRSVQVTEDQALGIVEDVTAKLVGQPWISAETARTLTRSLASLAHVGGGVGEKTRSAAHWIDIFVSDRKSEKYRGRDMVKTHILADLSGARQWIKRLADAGGFPNTAS
jgi:hypothetical protein